jgi:hypothetical protein
MLWLLVTQGDISGRQAEFEAEEVGARKLMLSSS